MTIDKDGLAGLLERVREAKGPDRKLEEAIVEFAYNRKEAMTHKVHDLAMHRYTASIDASLALVERLLPGWSWKVVGEPGAVNPHCAVLSNSGRLSDVAPTFVGSHKTAPLAVVFALLSALKEVR